MAPAALGVCLAPGWDWAAAGFEGNGRFRDRIPVVGAGAALPQYARAESVAAELLVDSRARGALDRLQRLRRLAAILFMPRFTEPLWRR
jgi:hypothetical protein